MISIGPKQSAPTPQTLRLYDSRHSALRPSEQEDATPPSIRSRVKRLSSSTLFERPTSQRTSLSANEPSSPPPPLPLESFPAVRKRGPRYVPIVITQGVIASVLKDLPESPEQQEFDIETGHFSPFEALRHQIKLLHPPKSPQRPRHIPIVIPGFAQPYGPFPPTPSSSGGSTPRQGLLSAPASPVSNPMPRSAAGASRPGTADSTASTSSPLDSQGQQHGLSNAFHDEASSSQSSLNQDATPDSSSQAEQPTRPNESTHPGGTAALFSSNHTTTGQRPPVPGTTNLSGLVCNVHRCTGKEPHALVGATTTVLGDKLYVFGGKRLSRRRPVLTADLYELDLIRRHWTKLATQGSVPSPRYFHSMCALGDNKLICYGGMSPAPSHSTQSQSPKQPGEQPTEVIVMSDLHIYDTTTQTWTHIPTSDNPQGRYAHCATILPSCAVFTSANAPLSAIHHNPSSGNPNQGSIGVALDGTGGAEMVVVGGQDSANHYIEQISVFNLRSLKWTSTSSLGRSCGAYRSVVAPLTGIPASRVGHASGTKEAKEETRHSRNAMHGPSSMLIYSNYNFLDVKLELQIRHPDGSLEEKTMGGPFSPPGLRFPNGGVLDNQFVVSGTYLTSSKQEYALWALDLRTLTWNRIDADGSVFTQGSWNRGVLWPRSNTFVILGNRKRNLVEDYNHRRINFSNICLVELEAFGLYNNPRHSTPTSSYLSFSGANLAPSLRPKVSTWTGGGRPHFAAAEELGQMVLSLRELADMEILSISGERIPVNSHILARRWGPYFIHLLREGSSADRSASTDSGADASTLRAPTSSGASRNSSITITPSINTAHSASTITAVNTPGSTINTANPSQAPEGQSPFHPPTSTNLHPQTRSRTLYLPHTPLTIQALLHYLYTSSLPPASHSLSTPQILCSLLQLARPYCVDGLLEAVVERLHQVLDGRNAPAVFNASAMAAGGGRGTGFKSLTGVTLAEVDLVGELETQPAMNGHGGSAGGRPPTRSHGLEGNSIERDGGFRNGAGVHQHRDLGSEGSEDDASSVDGGMSGDEVTGSGPGGEYVGMNRTEEDEEVWGADRSCVIGLQKRGLKGLMEGRKMRERGRSVGVAGGALAGAGTGGGGAEGGVG